MTSGAYFLFFCFLASKGISPIPLLEKFGLFTEYLKHVKDSQWAIIAVALLFNKLAAPIRLATTLYTVRALARRGKVMTSSEFLPVAKKYVKRKFPNK